MKTLEQCKAEHGASADLVEIEVAGAKYVIGNPSREAWRKWRSATAAIGASEKVEASVFAARTDHTIDAIEEVAKSACVSHTPQELEAAADVYYDAITDIGQVVIARFEAKQAALGKASAKPGVTQQATSEKSQPST